MDYFERIWLCGDIHGSTLPIENFYRRNKDIFNFHPDTDLIILLGDVGCNYYLNGRDKKFKKKLSSFPFTYFCIRGNHEERISNIKIVPEHLFYKLKFDGLTYIEKDFSNIIYADDITEIYNINNYSILTLPGAYSVDKYHRLKMGWNWFPDEQMNESEMHYTKNLCEANNWKFDIILSHTCPSIYEPTDLFLSQIDQSTVDKSMEHFFNELEYDLDYKLWCWGHFHVYRVYPRYENKQCIMLSNGQEILNLLEIMEDTNKYPIKY